MWRQYQTVRNRTEELVERLSAEDQCIQSMPDASPAKWHRAHTTWFFETFVLVGALKQPRLSPESWSVLFNSYYETVGERWHRPHRGLLSRPSVDEIGDYRKRIDAAMGRVLQGDLSEEVRTLIELGLHHEQQHQELLCTDLLHLLSLNPLEPSAGLPVDSSASDAGGEWVAHPGGTVKVGHTGPRFSYDNEGPQHPALLMPHAVNNRLVSNRQYLQFIEDGGYRKFALWMSLGWQTVQAQGWDAPAYWRKTAAGWHRFTLAGPIPLDLDAPVTHVSWFEADAFARWAGARLPTEFEWEAGAPEPPTSADPTQDHYGQVWQWTASAYAPYPGYKPAEGAVGEYNGKFMCNQYVLRGSSAATSAGHARKTYRNFFPPDARWQFTGLRLAKDPRP